MSNGNRYIDEFKIEKVKQIAERGDTIQVAAERLGLFAECYWNSLLIHFGSDAKVVRIQCRG